MADLDPTLGAEPAERAWAPAEMLPAWRLVPPPTGARRTARLLAVSLALFAVACVLSPWQQSVRGDGAVIAFAPSERPVTVEAPTSGVVRRWHVQEGDVVTAGQLLVSVTDNDPDQLVRLHGERDAASRTVDRKADGVTAMEGSLLAVELAAESKVASVRSKRDSVREKLDAVARKVEAAEAKRETAARNRDRVEALGVEGLASERQRELARLDFAEADAQLRAARADARGAQSDLDAASSDLEEAESSARSKVAELEGKVASARSDLEGARAKLLEAETKLGRQLTQEVRAPRDGVVMRQLVAEGSEQVKPGDALALLVPPRKTMRVALTVDGNDAALLAPGRPVRVQFEGWPAVQFVGWPSAAVGTFGGEIEFIDAASDSSGDFRVVVRPDPTDLPWPPAERLRPGVRAHGWVLLEQVPLGFELWRQLNGFPPTVPPPDAPAKGAK
jgi:adhesin transport system membrane fusion protein